MTFIRRAISTSICPGRNSQRRAVGGYRVITWLWFRFDGYPVRYDMAMTGRITLRGEVLPIGGLKEKLLYSARWAGRGHSSERRTSGILLRIPDNIKSKLEIIPVKWIDRVLELALERLPQPLADDAVSPVVAPPGDNASAQTVVTH